MYFLPIPELSNSDFLRFWNKVTVSTKAECWNWTGGCTGNEEHRRRPYFRIGEHHYIAARVAWKSFYKQEPGEFLVCYECSPPSPSARQLCVNPNHLWLGTYSENLADAAAKGEAPTKNRSKLNDDNVRKIRRLSDEGVGHTRIGEMFNLSRNQIWRIVTHKSFAEVI